MTLKLNDKYFIKSLIEWYHSNKRNFDWRKDGISPFHLLIAEILLQKTNANQVMKVFAMLTKRIQTVDDLDKMDTTELIKILTPLGLSNRRANHLKSIAKLIIINNGTVPSSKEELLNLPGVGNYICNAVLCFAFSQCVPIIDANVARIIKRVYSFPIKGAPSRDKNLATKMEELIPKQDFREFNYALLDLGAKICSPKKPKCLICPLKDICDYHKTS